MPQLAQLVQLCSSGNVVIATVKERIRITKCIYNSTPYPSGQHLLRTQNGGRCHSMAVDGDGVGEHPRRQGTLRYGTKDARPSNNNERCPRFQSSLIDSLQDISLVKQLLGPESGIIFPTH
jgi:hypothetical protein